MTVTSVQLIAAIKSLLENVGGFQLIATGMPHLVIPEGLCAFVAMESMAVTETSLEGAVELRSARVRLTRAYASASFADIETELAEKVDAVQGEIYGNFTFSSLIRNPEFTNGFGVTWSDEQIPNEGPWFRCADITVPAVIHSDVLMTA